MNLRILKKLSKRAVPYLAKIERGGKLFRAEKGDSYTKTLIWDRSCWERGASVHGDKIREGEIKWLARSRKGRGDYLWCYAHPPSHPLKGTMMIGATTGYYQPEWDEETAWEALQSWVHGQFFDYDPETNEAFSTRPLRTVTDIFRAADELLAQKGEAA